MLSTPWSLGFVLAVILGAMLVPGCRPEDGGETIPRSRTLYDSETVHLQETSCLQGASGQTVRVFLRLERYGTGFEGRKGHP
jgi:hypothetical protein